jgi:hypothetical protein
LTHPGIARIVRRDGLGGALMTKYTKYSCALAGVLLGFAGTPGFAASVCSIPLIGTFDNQTSHGAMTVSSGRPCTIRFRNSNGPVYGVSVVQPARNGAARSTGYANITYKSRSGFVGSDTFTFAAKGQTPNGAPSTRTIIVAVNVIR